MARVLTLEQAAKLFIWFFLAVVTLVFGPMYAESLPRTHGLSEQVRWLAVAITVASFVPWFAYVVWAIAAMDEYYRRIVLVGTAMAFLMTVLYSIGLNTALEWRLVGVRPGLNMLSGFAVWAVGIMISALYHRVRG